eukprot:PITA_02721
MWLVYHKKILTWDNIRERCILGPSKCQLCEAQEETMEHLLNSDTFTSRLWDTFASICQKTDKGKESIINTILKQHKETVGTTVRNLPNNPPSEADKRILRQLGMQRFIPQGLNRKVIIEETKKEFWHPPPKSFLKYNIDGASKGNLGVAGFGGVLRD